ncbi:hypothetical protein TGPRC2_305900 [Toxoplasma gondii TgCatPRC2]|uniref:Uncharacterized protein n=14 Tax=Toxoplasma gondii TaxID=5811 RepID=A0A125YLM9_TOXGV|nr:hypothetical protein TGME49_305900 [Toxoplasma gondii ME49]EPR57506.1 hypothetical protein TGGT1_305900 [Toxoplasma gondii GT1]ESS28980.1 hypothetical protein TGVEG_305900 [Toxoplasma gondii VEG]KAF4644752.1 hypothetical protein TGRH88_017460 [Toxoplasma gondii]KFG30347.1 hypothetical protein TGP89_305900 [Toxoplasma gondii p89]KFG33448.1 hypothetical protein TGDOM2_305900 [Toxoplasma gondii GAB2-2007-GAL-DOM2]KFG45063.1 hypothetical protein TGFOU_305900 [Toxoplasma gondii FOU]KFG59309.1 |eukprot:XP_002370362.2 hypothetical protein TGME49_305900 [Toxoplasma gondii ME49]
MVAGFRVPFVAGTMLRTGELPRHLAGRFAPGLIGRSSTVPSPGVANFSRPLFSRRRVFLNSSVVAAAGEPSCLRRNPSSVLIRFPSTQRFLSTNQEPTRTTRSSPGAREGPGTGGPASAVGAQHGKYEVPFSAKRQMDLKVGPYTRGKIFISPREDPKEFILSCLVVFVMLYTLYNLPRGEFLWERRQRLIRERLLKEYGLTEADLDEIEGDEAPLSDDLPETCEATSLEGKELSR